MASWIIQYASFGVLGLTTLRPGVWAKYASGLARAALIDHHHELVTGLRHFGQALDFDRDGRASRFDRLAVLIQHGADTTLTGRLG